MFKRTLVSAVSLGFAALAGSITAAAQAPQACVQGMVREPAGYCCWPGQSWSVEYERCAGVPRCPAGTAGTGATCESVESPAREDVLAPIGVGGSWRMGAAIGRLDVTLAPPRDVSPEAQRRTTARALVISGVVVGVGVGEVFQLTMGILGASFWHQCYYGGCGAVGGGGAVGLAFVPLLGPFIASAGAAGYNVAAEFLAYALPATLLQGLSIGLLAGGLRMHADLNKSARRRAFRDAILVPFTTGTSVGASLMFSLD